VQSIAISVRVCVSVYPLVCLEKRVSKFHEIFRVCYLLQLFGPPLTIVYWFQCMHQLRMCASLMYWFYGCMFLHTCSSAK